MQIDGGGFSASTSPKAYTKLAGGSHTFDVRAVDAYGNANVAVSRTWTVDALGPPTPSIDTGPAAGSTSGKSVSFGFSDTEGTATFEVQIDGGAFALHSSAMVHKNLSRRLAHLRRACGGHLWEPERSRDGSWTVDAGRASDPSIDSGPAAGSRTGKNVSFGFSDTEGTATFEVQIDGAPSSTRRRAYTNLDRRLAHLLAVAHWTLTATRAQL